MGVPRDELLLMVRALKRGIIDPKSIRKALHRQISRPVTLLEALHLPAADQEALRADESIPDASRDRDLLDTLRETLVSGEHVTPSDWEKFLASLSRPTGRAGYPGVDVPREFDGITLQWELARRERGVVYRAKDADGRDIAVKIFREGVEATGLPRVNGLAYARMPFADGETFEARKQSARRGVEAVQKAAEQLRGRTHGALTPARIVVARDDSVTVLGFEHAAAVEPSVRARAYGPGDDVKALGAILYEGLVGTPPAGETSPRARSAEVDPALDRIVGAALSGGYGSTGDFADDLGRFLRGEPVTARNRVETKGGGTRRAWIVPAAAAAAAVALLAAWLVMRGGGEPEPPEPPPSGPETVRRPERPKPPEPAKPATPKAPVPDRPPLTEQDEQALRTACTAAFAEGDWERVVAAAGEAETRGTEGDWPFFYLGHAYIAREELDLALEYAGRALDRAPEKEEHLELLAHVHAYRGEVAKTRGAVERLTGGKPGALNRMIMALNPQIDADPDDARALILRGALFAFKRHWASAERDFGEAVRKGRQRALAWRAWVRREAGDVEEARRDAEAYLESFPSDFASGEVRDLLGTLRPH